MNNEPLIYVTILLDDNIECMRVLMPQLSFADKVVVVDGGCKDGGAEYVKSFNNVIYIYNEWEFDFGKQRNIALNECPVGSWVLSVDTDEILTDDFIENARDILKDYDRRNVDRLLLLIYHLNKDVNHCNKDVGAELKLFKHVGGSYTEKTHEYYDGNFSGISEFTNPLCGVIHFKYLMESRHAKRKLYLEEKVYEKQDLDDIEFADIVEIPKNIRFTVSEEQLRKITAKKEI